MILNIKSLHLYHLKKHFFFRNKFKYQRSVKFIDTR